MEWSLGSSRSCLNRWHSRSTINIDILTLSADLLRRLVAQIVVIRQGEAAEKREIERGVDSKWPAGKSLASYHIK